MVYFQTKNPNLGNIWEGLTMEDVGILYGHLVYSLAIWISLWYFGIYFPRFGMLHQEKSGNPVSDATLRKTEVSFTNIGPFDHPTIRLSDLM
jgi:hypothetical protein